MKKELFPQPSAAARLKDMTRGARERFSGLTPEHFIEKASMFQAMSSSLPAWVRPPDVEELTTCLNALIKDGVFKKVKNPSHPTNQWSEPAYQVVLPQEPMKFIKALPKGESIYYCGTHKCERCGLTIEGKGRHGKSSRGHGKAVCDAAMVADMMED